MNNYSPMQSGLHALLKRKITTTQIIEKWYAGRAVPRNARKSVNDALRLLMVRSKNDNFIIRNSGQNGPYDMVWWEEKK